MGNFETLASEFLPLRHFAVAGVSQTKQDAAICMYPALRDRDYEVPAVNPCAPKVEGDPFLPNLQGIPAGVGSAMIAIKPEITKQLVHVGVEASVPRVWIHNKRSSASEKATAVCREIPLTVMDGVCPRIFNEFGRKCLKWVPGSMRRLPAG